MTYFVSPSCEGLHTSCLNCLKSEACSLYVPIWVSVSTSQWALLLIRVWVQTRGPPGFIM